MRSSILLNPDSATQQKVKDIKQMAAQSTQRLTFYEDLYLKPQKKTASLPIRMHRNTQKQQDKRQSATVSSPRLDRSVRNSGCKSPVNNPLLDSPPSSRPLTLASRGSSQDSLRRTSSYDETNNNAHPALRGQSSTNNYANLMFTTLDETQAGSIYNQLLSPPLRRAHTFPDDHVYEVIPAQKQEQSQSRTQQKKHYDDNNYLVPSSSPYPKSDQVRLRRSRDHVNGSSSNLKTMRRMGRSMDSISRSVTGNKLRSQSTILAPQLWMRDASKGPIQGAASCNNLTAQTLEFGRLSHGLTIQDKENTSPDQLELRQGEVDLRTISTSSSNHSVSVSPRHRRSEDNVSQKSSNSSLHSAGSRNSHSNHRRCYHRHSSSYAGSTSSAYENMDHLYRHPEGSNYVNIKEYLIREQDKELNYADLDFTSIKQLNNPEKTKTSCSVTPTKQPVQNSSSVEQDDNHVEYTMINITATEAARKACAEHQRYRQRRVNSSIAS